VVGLPVAAECAFACHADRDRITIVAAPATNTAGDFPSSAIPDTIVADVIAAARVDLWVIGLLLASTRTSAVFGVMFAKMPTTAVTPKVAAIISSLGLSPGIGFSCHFLTV
jgi:hypothetical protein